MGCGKTYLARHIARLVADMLPPEDERYRYETVAYCCLGDVTDGNEFKTPQTVLAWLLHDILTARPELVPEAKLNRDQLVCDFDFDSVQRLWAHMIKKATEHSCHLTLIIDEIDQLNMGESDLDKFFQCITCHHLPATTSGRVRLLVLSRPEERLQATLTTYKFSRYDITVEDTKADITKTMEEVLRVFPKYPNGHSIAQDIRQQINQDAEGMYLWARLALSEAVNRLSRGSQQGGRLNRGIFALFKQYLQQISESNIHKGISPRNVLFWITYQAKPMLERELQIACAMVETVGTSENPLGPRWTSPIPRSTHIFRNMLVSNGESWKNVAR